MASVKLIAVDGAGATVLATYNFPSGMSGSRVVPLGGLGFSGRVSLRAELLTNDGLAGHRAYTNPIEVDFDPATAVEDSPSVVEGGIPRNVPNPFNPRTQIRFALAEDSQVTLDIYSSAKRLVHRLLAPQMMERGSHTIDWDGRGDQGQVLASGVYLYSISTDQSVQSGKMSLVR